VTDLSCWVTIAGSQAPAKFTWSCDRRHLAKPANNKNRPVHERTGKFVPIREISVKALRAFVVQNPHSSVFIRG